MVISKTLALNDNEIETIEKFLTFITELSNKTGFLKTDLFDYIDCTSKVDQLHRIKIAPSLDLEDIEDFVSW